MIRMYVLAMIPMEVHAKALQFVSPKFGQSYSLVHSLHFLPLGSLFRPQDRPIFFFVHEDIDLRVTFTRLKKKKI